MGRDGLSEPWRSGGKGRNEQSRHLARRPGRQAVGAEDRYGGFAIDPAELFRVFEAQAPKQRAMDPDTKAATGASGQTETSTVPQAAETNDIAVAFATLGAELKGLLGLAVEERADTGPRQHDTERQAADFTERNAQLAAELIAVQATAKKAIAEYG